MPLREPQTQRASEYEGMIPEEYKRQALQKRQSVDITLNPPVPQMYPQDKQDSRQIRYQNIYQQQKYFSTLNYRMSGMSNGQIPEKEYHQYQQRERMVSSLSYPNFSLKTWVQIKWDTILISLRNWIIWAIALRKVVRLSSYLVIRSRRILRSNLGSRWNQVLKAQNQNMRRNQGLREEDNHLQSNLCFVFGFYFDSCLLLFLLGSQFNDIRFSKDFSKIFT